MEAAKREDLLTAGALEIRPGDGLVLAAGRALTLSVREFQLLCALVRRQGGIVARHDLYRAVWGGELREGDRSIDVYVHKLRVKLDSALPGWHHIHTHVGFGYRFQPESITEVSHRLHTAGTSTQQDPGAPAPP